MDKSQPLAVKLTDDSARPAAKPGKAAKVATKLSGPSHQERMAAFQSAAGSAKTGKAPVQVEGLRSLAERQAEMQQSQKTDSQQRSAVGSVKARLEEFKAAAEATSAARGRQVQIEGQMPLEQRKQLLLQGTKTEDREERKDAVKTGKVAEMAALLLQKKEVEKTRNVEVVGSLSERMKAFQEAAKSSSDKGKSNVMEGLPSIKERTQQLFTRTKAEDTRESVVVPGTVKERLSLFTSGKAWKRDGEESEEEEAEESPEEEPEQPVEDPTEVRKSKAQQSLLEKYASKAPAKTSAKKTEDREETKEEKSIKPPTPTENVTEPEEMSQSPVDVELPAIEDEETGQKEPLDGEEIVPVGTNPEPGSPAANVEAAEDERLQLAPAEVEDGKGAVVKEEGERVDEAVDATITAVKTENIAGKEAEVMVEGGKVVEEEVMKKAEVVVEGGKTVEEGEVMERAEVILEGGKVVEEGKVMENAEVIVGEGHVAEEAKLLVEGPQIQANTAVDRAEAAVAKVEDVLEQVKETVAEALVEQPKLVEEELKAVEEQPLAIEEVVPVEELPKAIENIEKFAEEQPKAIEEELEAVEEAPAATLQTEAEIPVPKEEPQAVPAAPQADEAILPADEQRLPPE